MALARPSGDDWDLALPDEAATKRLGRALAGLLRRGDLVALGGALGSGKTSLARALINALPRPAGGPEGAEGPDAPDADEEVPSPTFTLVQIYERRPAPVWHFDLFRLEAPEEALELGLEEALAEAISLVEWPERLGPLLPAERLDLRLDFADDPQARRARLRGHGGWRERLPALLAACHD